MDANPKASHSRSGMDATIEVSLSDDCTHLIGTCPTCGSRLSIEVREDGSHNQTVSCVRCRGLYWVQGAASSSCAEASGLGVSYAVEGKWNVPMIMEYLFDNVGPVEYVEGGFVCHLDDQEIDFPTIMVDERSRIVRFGLFGNYQESDATAIINQAVAEFGGRFQLELRPFALDRWEYRDDTDGFSLIERRPLGTFWRERARRQAHA